MTSLAPGVYVREVSSGVRSIVGAGTSTPAFIGFTPQTVISAPTLVRSWTDFSKKFLPTDADIKESLTRASAAYQEALQAVKILEKLISDAPDAASKVIVTQAKIGETHTAAATFVASVVTALANLGLPRWQDVDTALEAALKVTHSEEKAADIIFTVYSTAKTHYATAVAPTVTGLTATATAAATAADALSSAAVTAVQGFKGNFDKITGAVVSKFGLVDASRIAAAYARREQSAKDKWNLAEAVLGYFANGGSQCYIVPLEDGGILGKALALLETQQDVSMVVVPDLHNKAEVADVSAVVNHCAKMKNRVAILHTPRYSTDQEALAFRNSLNAGANPAFGSLYFPWVTVPGVDGVPRSVPPVGHVAGVWAATDSSRGVFKAPANVSLAGASGLDVALSDEQQGVLNDKGVNCLRSFPGRPLMVWGARTLAHSSDRDWKYLSVRRLVCFLSDSIQQATSWAVFEPNDERLWATLRQSVSAFLRDQWRRGALQGSTPDEAFLVVCDKTNNTDDLVNLGEVHCDVFIAPVRPAEFVHFTIQQTAGQAP
ncbi:Phage tail sheath protein (plasmid) [Streptomyces sp. YIM 121038]|uniref:phage tail sheath family protein n=1 Tax=Streptomyces sp. YIM 121038 TaxID=2136401 RepID=UPI0011104F81|nr:phage tail sheath subtilisin-like domain-containing protein [Streptomyces sp. YIM 121038]QCX82319.1 Phage tail sheath protein [Streptomyces sp. YIM 121038]